MLASILVRYRRLSFQIDVIVQGQAENEMFSQRENYNIKHPVIMFAAKSKSSVLEQAVSLTPNPRPEPDCAGSETDSDKLVDSTPGRSHHEGVERL